MGSPLSKRIARLLRLATAWAVGFHGLVVPWTPGTLYAQNPDTLSFSVQPVSNAPPGAVSDLLASANLGVEGQISLSWTAPQGNAGGTPIANQPVVAYLVHLATFSVSSLGGDTNAWWVSTSSGAQMLQAPANTPQPPGSNESLTYTGLVPGATYYFGIKSISLGGITSPIDSLASSPALQAKAVSTKFPPPTIDTPQTPTGLSAVREGSQFRMDWHAVTLDTTKQPISISQYRVYRYDAISSTPTLVGTLGPSTTSYTEPMPTQTYYYRVVAVSAGAISSAASDYVDTAFNRIITASDDATTRVIVPDAITRELNKEYNGYGEDININLVRRQPDEVDVTLRSYRVEAVLSVSGQTLPNFSFRSNEMSVQLGLGAVLGSSPGLTLPPNAAAGSIAQIVSVYWYNGASYIRLSDPVLTSAQSISVNVRNVGIYQVRATQISTVFKLTSNSPYPRVITPNDASQNNRVFWFFDNPTGDPVEGTIYDIRGAKVRDIRIDSLSPTSNSIVWNGRDENGSVVPSGVYIYLIRAGKEKATGTIVVAR